MFSINELSRKYYWSTATLYSINRQRNYYQRGRSKRKITNILPNEVNNLASIIQKYMQTHSEPWVVKDFQEYIKAKHSKSYQAHTLRKIMIEDLHLSYKKVSSRPKCYVNAVIQEARVLFAVKYVQNLSIDTLLLNVDETIIGRDWRQLYSWSHKGINQEWQNIGVSRSIKLILTIASNGWWFCLATHSNINSK